MPRQHFQTRLPSTCLLSQSTSTTTTCASASTRPWQRRPLRSGSATSLISSPPTPATSSRYSTAAKVSQQNKSGCRSYRQPLYFFTLRVAIRGFSALQPPWKPLRWMTRPARNCRLRDAIHNHSVAGAACTVSSCRCGLHGPSPPASCEIPSSTQHGEHNDCCRGDPGP